MRGNKRKALCSLLLIVFYLYGNNFIRIMHESERRRQMRYLWIRKLIEKKRTSVVKSGIASHRFQEMDDQTLRRHLRVDSEGFAYYLNCLKEMGLDDRELSLGGPTACISLERKGLIFLWYMANSNSFREISDKFDVAQGSAHKIVVQILSKISYLSSNFIKWPSEPMKRYIADRFEEVSGLNSVIGAIDGCHIRILKPARHGNDYLNRKQYYSILLQGVCDNVGRFTDIFVGPPGRVHDARMLKTSPLYSEWLQKMCGNRWKLLGDSAYVSHEFPFILTPKKNYGNLTAEDVESNHKLSRGRVCIENAFGRLKCRFRRLHDIQNTNLENIVRLVVAGCALHNMFSNFPSVWRCEDHPDGCPRQDDVNDDYD